MACSDVVAGVGALGLEASEPSSRRIVVLV
jgi:hypothetical protein